jgi:hypothetical protein
LIEPGTPIGAADYIQESELEGNIFHPQGYGDYLIWRLWPNQRVFFDGRVHLYNEDLVHDYLNIMAAKDWQRLLQEYEIQHVLLPRQGPSGEQLRSELAASAEWLPVYQDDTSILYSHAP